MRFLLLSAFALSLSLASAASAQPGWMPRPAGGAVALDVVKPLGLRSFDVFTGEGDFVGEAQPDGLTSALALSARVPLGPSLTLDVQLPVSILSTRDVGLSVEEGEGVGRTEAGVGNPYAGVSWTVREGNTAVHLDGGVRLPLGGGGFYGGGSGTAWLLAVPEQREAFLADLASVRLAAGVRQRAGPVVLDARLAPVLGVSTEEFELRIVPSEPSEVIRPTFAAVGFSLLATGGIGTAEFAGGLIGSRRIDSVDDYGYPHTTALVASAALAGPVRPHLRARYGLGGFAVNSVGLGVSVSL